MSRACICFSSSRVGLCSARTRFGFLPPFFLVVLISIRPSLLTHRYHGVHLESRVIRGIKPTRLSSQFRARDFARAATGSRRRAESRTEATSHFARAACLVLCGAVIVRIVFDLVLRPRMLAANTVLIIFNQPNSPKKNGPASEGSPIASPNTDRKREGQRPSQPFPPTKLPRERPSTSEIG